MNSLTRAVQLYRTKRVFCFLRFVWRLPKRLISLYYNAFKSGTFTFRGQIYNYFYHRYNATWRNERAIEVPIVRDIVEKYKGKRILEVGNVLSHYFPIQHTILDKYEKASGVINLDVVDFQPAEKYDLIVSISTLEHVGWDEEPREPGKILRALENLKRCSAPGGQIVVTLPLGQNKEMVQLLSMGKIRFTEQYCLKQISRDNKWVEVAWDKIRHPIPPANAVVIGIINTR